MSSLFISSALLPIFGIIFGSFVGVIYHRKMASHIKKEIIKTRSHCDTCYKKLTILELLPIVSYLILRGRCRDCQARIPIQYFFIEILFLIISLNILLLPLDIVEAYMVLVVIGLLVTQAISDFLNKELFTLASVFIAIIGIIQSLTFSSYSSIILSLAGFITGFMSLYLINKIYYLFKLRNGIGEGDFLLFGAILAIHGLEMFGPILLIASCITLGIGYLTHSLQGEMPLGTGLAIAGIVFLLIPL
tara:strand:+ start:1373 stop:2113 length:741 start_codon:yes stop_codon:yes gene_type:complete